MAIQIIWPERRAVHDEQIQRWARDAVANGEIQGDSVDLESAHDCARALDGAGLVTLGRPAAIAQW